MLRVQGHRSRYTLHCCRYAGCLPTCRQPRGRRGRQFVVVHSHQQGHTRYSVLYLPRSAVAARITPRRSTAPAARSRTSSIHSSEHDRTPSDGPHSSGVERLTMCTVHTVQFGCCILLKQLGIGALTPAPRFKVKVREPEQRTRLRAAGVSIFIASERSTIRAYTGLYSSTLPSR